MKHLSIPEFEKRFNAGEFDFAYMNPYHMLRAFKAKKYFPLIRDHGRKLFGVLTVKKDGPIKKVEELDGQTIAFPAPNALGASLVMRAELKELKKIKIKPKYVKTHSSVYLHVALGLTPAGGGVMGTLNRQKSKIKDKLRVLYKTRTMSPHPFAARTNLDIALIKKVKNALLELGQEEEGMKLLAKIPIKKIGVATVQDYIEMEKWNLEKYYVRPNDN